jgi:uncharacterized membrane protein (DUF4010 family)
MTASVYFYRFALAVGLGLLVGIQRESTYDEPEGKLFAGVRTFPLYSLAGYVLALTSAQLESGLPFLAGLIAMGALLVLAYHADVIIGKPGMTTEMSAIISYGLGGMCYWGLEALAAAIGVAVVALLSFKPQFRRFAHAVTREDMYATVQFAVISVIVLPLLPNESYGPPPFDIFNPYSIWLMVVFISGVSFLGYILIKIVGARRGIGLTGLLGGFASSTAVTLSFAQRSRESEELARPFALAILVAWAVMFVRVLIIVFTLAPELARRLVIPLVSAAVVGAIYAGYLYLVQRSGERDTIEFSNPFELGPAIRFGAIYAVVLLVSRAAQVYFGDLGVYISSFASGLADVDAIALSMVDLTQGASGLDPVVATRAIVIAAMANTLFKGAFALVSGSPRLRRVLWPGLLLMLATGIGVAFIV